MGMYVSGAVSDGVIDVHMALQPLVHASSLSDVHWNPASILALLRIDEVARQCLEGSINRIDLILILLSRFTGPTYVRRRNAIQLLTVTE